MHILAIAIGSYSYLIFFLGLFGLLYKNIIVVTTISYFFISLLFFREAFISWLSKIHWEKTSILFLILIIGQALINFIGALGPELAFDALWYHLTLPKLYLQEHSIFYIPGGLLYYSAMPKLTEMYYAVALSFGTEILVKIIHFSFGLLSLIALYKLSRSFFSVKLSLITVAVFYSNLVIGWQSITAYIDLSRTFFEVMALWGFVQWWVKEEKKWLLLSALMLGFAITTKLLAFGTVLIFSVLIFYKMWKEQKALGFFITNILVYWWIVLMIPLPWLVFSFLNTGNPVYPFFTSIYPVSVTSQLINPLRFIGDVFILFTKSADPISPIYFLVLPLVFYLYKKFSNNIKMIVLFCMLAIIVWYVTPRTGGGRFMMPYLPAFSIIIVAAIGEIRNKLFYKLTLGMVLFTVVFSIVYRGIANAKYIPVILGNESKEKFLSSHLNFSFGDFYDIDGFFVKNIKPTDTVLLYGFHNLYYINFPFLDSSWVKKGDTFNYIATQQISLPQQFLNWKKIYENSKTHVAVYTDNRKLWVY